MKTLLVGILMISTCAVGYSIGHLTAAQQSPKQTMLLTDDMSSLPAKEARMWITEIPPGGQTPKHRHPGDVLAYVLEGSVLHTVEGKKPVTYSAGQAFHETGEVHWAINPSQTVPLKILAVQIADKGQPLTVPQKMTNAAGGTP